MNAQSITFGLLATFFTVAIYHLFSEAAALGMIAYWVVASRADL